MEYRVEVRAGCLLVPKTQELLLLLAVEQHLYCDRHQTALEVAAILQQACTEITGCLLLGYKLPYLDVEHIVRSN